MQVRKPMLLGSAFAALLLVIGISCFAVWRSATLAQQRVAALHDAHTQAGAALSAIRANVYLTAVLTRDYLLDQDPSRAPQYIEQFTSIRNDTERSFRLLQSTAGDEQQRQALAKLSAEVNSYWDPTETALDWTPEEKRAQRNALLRQRLHRRQEIFELVRRAEDLMSTNFRRERQRVTRADQEFRSSLVWITFAALAFGFVIAGTTLARMIALEKLSVAAEWELRRLSAQLRTAQESERKHLSRELHDQVGQMLTGLRMELAALARLNWSADSDIAASITHAKSTVEQTLKLVRNIAMLARPSMLDDLGLTPAVSWLAKEFSRSTGINVEAQTDPAADALPETYRTCIYRVIQEALTNAARHANARRIDVTLKSDGAAIRLAIEDDGVGFDPAAKKRNGIGLLGMEERVRELAGHFAVKSVPGNGTRVEVELPAPGKIEVRDDPHPDRGRPRNRPDRVETAI